MAPMDFLKLLSPHTIDDFLNRYWERDWLYIDRENASYFDDLLTMEEIDTSLFGNNNLAASPFKFYKGKTEARLEHWSANQMLNGVSTQVLDHTKGFKLLQQGFSMYLNYPNTIFPGINEFCNRIEHSLKVKTISHLIISPPSTDGFLPHTDPYGVFVLQISGKKRWNLYHIDEDRTSPQGKNKHMFHNQSPKHTLELRGGSMLYIPRGMIHSVSTHNEYSVHLSLGILPPKGSNIVSMFERMSGSISFFNAYVPYGFLSSDKNSKEYQDAFKKQLIKLIENTDIYSLLDASISNSQSNMVQRSFMKFVDSQLLTDKSILRVVSGLTYTIRGNNHEGSCAIEFQEKRVRFPLFWKTELERILAKETFAVEEIGHPLNIEINEQIQIAKNMINAGLLEELNP